MQFARNHPEITVVGIGAGSAGNGDSLDGALNFVQGHGATLANMNMLYDVSYQSWRNFGVVNQPWSIGFDTDGNQIFNQAGRVDLASVAAAFGVS